MSLPTSRSGVLVDDNGVSGDERVDGTDGMPTVQEVDERTEGIAEILIVVGVKLVVFDEATGVAPEPVAEVGLEADIAWMVGDCDEGVEEAEDDDEDRGNDGGNERES